jgi:hypothetical protein
LISLLSVSQLGGKLPRRAKLLRLGRPDTGNFDRICVLIVGQIASAENEFGLGFAIGVGKLV